MRPLYLANATFEDLLAKSVTRAAFIRNKQIYCNIWAPLCGHQNGRMEWPMDGRKRKMIRSFISDKKTSVIAVRKWERLKITYTSKRVDVELESDRTNAVKGAVCVHASPAFLTGTHRHGYAFVNIWKKRRKAIILWIWICWSELPCSPVSQLTST